MAGPVKLAYSVFGNTAAVSRLAPVVVLHGLFGSSKNWRSLAGRISTDTNRLVYTLDARNHGDSPHTPDMSYDLMSLDVMHFCQSHDLKKVVLMGHSMGGKSAMVTALNHPEIIDKLVVLDVSPGKAPGTNQTVELLNTISKLDISSLKNRREANEILKKDIPDSMVRDFLLTNLTSDPTSGQLQWKANLVAIGNYMNNLKSGVQISDSCPPFDRPTLFIGGKNSSYITSRDVPKIKTLFTNADVTHIPGAGHWVHFEKPNEFIKLVTAFIYNPQL